MTTATGWTRGGFLANLDPADADALVKRGSVRGFARGQALMHEGQVPDRVLLLRSGLVKVYRTTPTGKEVVLAVRGTGELVGELAAIDDSPHSASIVALERVEALVVSTGAFRRFLTDHPAVSLVLLRMLSRRLRDADSKRTEFTAFPTLGRVALRILELADDYGVPRGTEIVLESPLSQEEIAAWCHSSLESVGRALQTMRSLGWIETGRRRFTILDLDGIRSAVE
jgi:CRP/FNR family cyclic AMP-dependent transcriptional regulator